jgi:hypothetical protein
MRKLLRLITFAPILLVAGVSGVAEAQTRDLSPQLIGQLRALEQEKAARTPSERKISSHLLYEDRMRRGVPIARGIETLRSFIEVARDGTTLVDIRADVTPAVLQRLLDLGGRVVYASPRHRELRARIPIAKLRSLADLSEVDGIRPADRAFTRKIDTSEGDAAHRVDQLRSTLTVNGTGVSIGVLSDGVDSLASLQGSGDLPANVTVLTGEEGSGDEGSAMLEIIHDLAPGADLLFATAFTSQVSFANNIVALQQAGADVIVDDVGYFAEGVFQDDDVADAVNTVTAAGAHYFSSAGNGGNLNDDTSGVWEGNFVAASSPVADTNAAHDYGGGDVFNTIVEASPFAYSLHWSDALGASGNDYDLYVVNKSGKVIFGASTTVQDGNDDPFEIVGPGPNDKGNKLLIVRKSNQSPRFMHLNANRGRLEFATEGQTSGHSAARDAFSVAAVDVRDTSGAFDGTESVETYSSDGPRRVFYEADGTEITPGVYDSSGGEVRNKPDITAADCVGTASPGFSTFCGTSAAAPHAAAIAAMLINIDASMTSEMLRNALTATAIDIEAAGPDRDSGYGIVDALSAGESLSECQDDADCDDGSFCTGLETCSLGACVVGPGDPCDGSPDPFCDEAADVCVACLGDGNCDDGSFCTGLETCSLGACVVGPGDPCDGSPDPFCDEAADVCVACLINSDCGGTMLCEQGVCIEAVPALAEWRWALLVALLVATAAAFLNGRRSSWQG